MATFIRSPPDAYSEVRSIFYNLKKHNRDHRATYGKKVSYSNKNLYIMIAKLVVTYG